MLVTCKCLNVAIRLGKGKPKGIALPSLQLSAQEASHVFFSEGVAEVDEVVELIKQIPSMVVTQTVGDWTIESCINCSTAFLAQNVNKSKLPMINSSVISDPNTIQSLKNHMNFSPVFRIVIRDQDDDAIVLGENSVEKVKNALSGLEKQLGDMINRQRIKTEDNIRTFSDQQYELLDKYRDRASRDHRALIRVLRSAEGIKTEVIPTTPVKPTPPASLENLVRSTPKPPHAISTAIGITGRRHAGRSMSLVNSRGMGQSFDAEGIFNLEEMEDSPPEAAISDGESDTDHDDSGSHDEGIDLRRKKGNSMNIARSLPVNVPVFGSGRPQLQTVEFDPDFEDPQDIAASIKALARSVHGEALFGDLPRPRFSTQI